MSRRFSAGTDAAVAGVLVAAILILFVFRESHAVGLVAIALTAPAVAGLLVIGLACLVPALTSNGSPTRTDRVALAITHVALAHLVARAILTGSNPTVALHELLVPATLWLHPLPLVVLGAGSVAVQEFTQRRRRRPVSL